MSRRSSVYRSKDEWRRLIASWEASGKSIKEWCQKNGVPIASLRYANRRLSTTVKRSHFIRVGSKGTSGIELQFKRLSLIVPVGFDEETLIRCLRVVEGLSC